MAFHYRKHLSNVQKCSSCNEEYSIADPPLLRPPSPPPLPSDKNQNHHLSPTLIVIFCVFGAAFLLVSCLVFVKRYYSNLNNSRMRNRPTFDDDDREDFVDENQGPVIDHHIWYINTVGLQPSVIESIAVFKYKKDEGLIEGTDCPVCLNEFQEDETLRLLPKCSHAFHIPCIDTWLRSHQNCPLCRAPIVRDADSAHLSESEPNLNHLGPREENPVENLENYGHRVGGSGGTSEIGVGRTESFGRLPPPSEEGTIAEEILTKDSRYFNAKNCDNRVLSDLTDHRAKVKDEMQPVRRSISMDDLSASKIYLAVAANIHGVELEGCWSTRLVQVRKPNSEKVAKGGVSSSSSSSSRNSSISSRLKKSPSVGCSLQKGHHVAMKRSFSSSGKFTLPRRSSRSQDSILPL